jgi:hypothetical protein
MATREGDILEWLSVPPPHSLRRLIRIPPGDFPQA